MSHRGSCAIYAVCLCDGDRRIATNPVLLIDGKDPKREEAEKAAK